jgi:hypothetical protein
MAETFIDTNLSVLGLPNIRVLDASNEFIWFSQQDDWGHLYLHDLGTGRLVAVVGYLRWHHPLRGEIRPLDFLRVAETTGLGTTLSRAASFSSGAALA